MGDVARVNETTLAQLLFTRRLSLCAALTLLVIITALTGLVMHFNSLCDKEGKCIGVSARTAALVTGIVVAAFILFVVCAIEMIRQERHSLILNGEVTMDYNFQIKNEHIRRILNIKSD